MFAKQIASKDRHAYFSNENIADDVKRKTARKEVIRSEWCSFMRRFVEFIMSKVTDDNGTHLCIDKTVKEIYPEVALFVHQSLFHGKTWLTYKDTAKNHEFKTLVPSTDIILRDIKERTAKNKGNVKYYIEKVKNNKKNKHNKNNTSSFVSEDEEDDVDNKENEERINTTISDREVL